MLRDPEGLEGRMIRELLGPSTGDILEVGCGDGRLTASMMDASDRLVGLDPDRGSMEKARPLSGDGVMLVLGSGESVPFAADIFDIVVFSLSLHHQDPVRALEEARRVLKPGGRILVLEPVEHSLMTMLFSLIHDESEEYEKAEVAIRASGLREVRSHSLRTRWVFEDFDEMSGYLFGYFGFEVQPEKEKAMADLLGERCTQRPLLIEDITRFWLLEPGPDEDQGQVP